jgi:hypothetical protein
MWIVNDEYASALERDESILPVVPDLVLGRLGEPAQTEEIARVIPVNQVDGQSQRDDRIQRGRSHQIAAVQHGLRAERFRLCYGSGERLAVVVAVGNDADLQNLPPRVL